MPRAKKYFRSRGFSMRGGPVNVPAKFEVRSSTRSWDNIGVVKKFRAVPGYAHIPYSPKF